MLLDGDNTGVVGIIGGGDVTGMTNIIGIGIHSGDNFNTLVFTVIGLENHNGVTLNSGENVLAGTQRVLRQYITRGCGS